MNTFNYDSASEVEANEQDLRASLRDGDFIKKCKRDLYRTAKCNGRYVSIAYAGAQLDGKVKFHVTSSSGAYVGLVHHSKLTDYCL